MDTPESPQPAVEQPAADQPPKRRAGRPKGSKNKRTDALDAARQVTGDKIRAAIGPDAFSGDAWEYLVSLYADPSVAADLRLKAAIAAVKYERPALQATELTGANGSPLNPPDTHIVVEYIDPPPRDDD